MITYSCVGNTCFQCKVPSQFKQSYKACFTTKGSLIKNINFFTKVTHTWKNSFGKSPPLAAQILCHVSFMSITFAISLVGHLPFKEKCLWKDWWPLKAGSAERRKILPPSFAALTLNTNTFRYNLIETYKTQMLRKLRYLMFNFWKPRSLDPALQS